MKNHKFYTTLYFILFATFSFSQEKIEHKENDNSRKNELLYELTPIRENFDVQFYDLDFLVDIENKSLKGSNIIHFKAVKDLKKIQIDLAENMNIDAIEQNGKNLKYKREESAIFIDLNKTLKSGDIDSIEISYSGQPIAAKNAPWDGGFVWNEDEKRNPWIGVAVEGIGANTWWPNKDHWSDEPEQGVQVAITVPSHLKAISNGNMVNKQELENELTKYTWKTSYSIDNYNVTLYIGDYINYKDYYEGLPSINAQGIMVPNKEEPLEIDYYVLKHNLEKAKKHFTFTEDVLQTFEYAFGPYPFKKDGFAIIESPYLGMEHQGAIAYGNNYQMGWNGKLSIPYIEFDYLFVHEVGHEWWGNNISVDDRAAMWIQEGFTTYADAFYVYSMFGYEGYLDYMDYYKTLVTNKHPVLGKYGKKNPSNLDQYYKSALMLHTLSQLVESNKDWIEMMKKAQQKFKAPKTVSHEEFTQFLSDELRIDLKPFFKQYLETTDIPKLVARIKKSKAGVDYLVYKWANTIPEFDMPVKLKMTKENNEEWIYPTTSWKKVKLPKKYKKEDLEFNIRTQYYNLDFK